MCLSLMLSLVNYNFIEGSEKMRRKFLGAGLNIGTLKPQYSEQVRQTLFVHYIELFTISNVICLVNPQRT